MCFYLVFSFLGFKIVDKGTMNLSERSDDFGFLNFIWLDCGVYKPALSKSDFPWDNSYCLRLVIVSLDLNVVRLQFLVSEDNFFCCVYSNL